MDAEQNHNLADISKEREVPETTYYEGILFHGAPRPFVFRTDYKYDNPEDEGSQTLGLGLYTTDELDVASNYSEVRQAGYEDKSPFIYTLYAPNCKFLDFRGEHGNVPVTKDILSRWRDYFAEQLRKEIEARPDLGPEKVTIQNPGESFTRFKTNGEVSARKEKQVYLEFLRELEDQSRIDLRVMLGTDTSGSTPWIHYFKRFVMGKLGYDGIIIEEGGEGEKAKDHATFVIYNLDSVYFSKNWLPVGILERLQGKQTSTEEQ